MLCPNLTYVSNLSLFKGMQLLLVVIVISSYISNCADFQNVFISQKILFRENFFFLPLYKDYFHLDMKTVFNVCHFYAIHSQTEWKPSSSFLKKKLLLQFIWQNVFQLICFLHSICFVRINNVTDIWIKTFI